MKKVISRIVMGLVFLMFGFVIVTQLNTVTNQSVTTVDNSQSPDILVENEQLVKEKEELQKKVDELSAKYLEYEKGITGETEESKIILDELQNTRLKAGLTDVEGQGIVIYINPKNNLLTTQVSGYTMEDFDLLKIVNELNAAGAEAVSINDIRLIGSSGIRTAANSIIVNNERISPVERVTIKAIGNKIILEGAIKFPGNIPDLLNSNYQVTYETKDILTIKKVKNSINYEYIKEVIEN